MRKTVVPTIVILVLASLIFLFIAKEYSDNKRANIKAQNEIKEQEESKSDFDDGPIVDADRLVAEDTCIIISVDEEEKLITLRNVKGGEDKQLSYDGTTHFLTKNGKPLVASQLQIGDIVDVSFATYNATLSKVQQSKDAWEYKEVDKFIIDDKGRTISVGDDLYEIAKNSIIASKGKVGKLLDITALDTITLKGIGKEVYSIQIEEGHGYIRVKNDSYFVGGWIEVGQETITVLTEGMLIPVPEGSYDIKVTNKGYIGRETVKVKRDKETILDLSKVEIEEVAIGHVMFTIVPDYAQLYVDGLMTDFEERVPLEYGVHSIRVELAGHETIHTNIRVGSEFANISIELDEDESDSSSSSSSNRTTSSSTDSISNTSSSDSLSTSSSSDSSSSSSSSSSSTSSDASIISDNKKLYVEGPEGVEVYLDGTYIGIAPCNTLKVTGTHTITLSKTGYETKSYTINVGNDNKDLTMSFSELSAVQ